MNLIQENKRGNYLKYFQSGVYDGLFNQKKDPTQSSSAYYSQGFDYGLELLKVLEFKKGG